MQWNINLKCGSSIEFIKAYVQLQLKKKTQIVTWDAGKPVVSNNGEVIYGNRLITDLSDSNFALKITNAQYNDSGNYSMSVITVQPLRIAHGTVPVFVYGMCFCYFKVSMFLESCPIANLSDKYK